MKIQAFKEISQKQSTCDWCGQIKLCFTAVTKVSVRQYKGQSYCTLDSVPKYVTPLFGSNHYRMDDYDIKYLYTESGFEDMPVVTCICADCVKQLAGKGSKHA